MLSYYERDRQTDRQRQRETKTDRDREREREGDRDRENCTRNVTWFQDHSHACILGNRLHSSPEV